MDSLVQTMEEETARVRAGRIRDAVQMESTKSDLARRYAAESERVMMAKDMIGRALPAALDGLRKRHEAFQALLKKNLTVLATAHAVAEGIIRGVSGELARKQGPSTYGATGRANMPKPMSSPPIAVSRSL